MSLFRYSTPFLSCIFLVFYSQLSNADESCDELVSRYVFSWPISDNCEDSPRGGTSLGSDVEFDKQDHVAWLAIQDPTLSKFEKDRAAILAMSGGYRVDFDFLETVGFSPEFKRDRPYHSWGTEYVYIVEDKPEYISLQHVMVMYFKNAEGETQKPFILKHWRQDWAYQDKEVLEYDHRNKWVKRSLSKEQSKGAWTQSVFQVDDSPRYESFGRWVHNGSFSSWLSSTTRRPLPRREFSVRQDYQVMEGFNRHTITRHGWVQEEENWKLVVDVNGKPNAKTPYLSKELGIARYRLVTNVDFTPGDDYMNKTKELWTSVRKAWAIEIGRGKSIELHKKVDGKPLFSPLFNYADQLVEGQALDDVNDLVRELITRYVK